MHNKHEIRNTHEKHIRHQIKHNQPYEQHILGVNIYGRKNTICFVSFFFLHHSLGTMSVQTPTCDVHKQPITQGHYLMQATTSTTMNPRTYCGPLPLIFSQATT